MRFLFIFLTLVVAVPLTAAQARAVRVTEAGNGTGITLGTGGTLSVQLPAGTAAGHTWHVVNDPGSLLQLSGEGGMSVYAGIDSSGCPPSMSTMSRSTWESFYFKVPRGARATRHGTLSLFRLWKNAGTAGRMFWWIKYTINAYPKARG